MTKQPHLKIDRIGKYVLLPGDPARIDKILKFAENQKEVIFNREFRIAKADYKGIEVSAVSTGIGCPSAAIAIEELAKIGMKTAIRVGTCGGLLEEMQPGDIVIPTAAFCGEGTTKEYEKNIEIVEAEEKVVEALKKAAENFGIKYFTGINRTHDAFYESTENFVELEGKGFVSSEMECSAVFFVSKLRGISAGAILVVNTPEPPELVKKNPDIIYQLIDKSKVERGIDNASRIALKAIEILEEK